ncbi:MAG TPA: hypothetical protein PKV73_17570 [Agriterribacter sp.]|nr:hypothetical protein [Agriterribacter sp.]
MKNRFKLSLLKYLPVIIIALSVSPVCAQQFATAVTELQKIQNTYSDSGYTSFTVKYQYAREAAPSKILDTLSFFYKMKNKKYYCKVDKIEFLQNDSINVAVYHNEKTIILSNPSVSTEKGRLAIDNWDSAFIASNIDSVYVTENKSNKTISFHFTPESRYSSCSITYNSKTYQPQKISYIEKATQNYEEGQTKPNGIIITMLFSGLTKTAFNESVFDERKFITNQQNKWNLTQGFSGYNIVNNFYRQ